MPTSPAQQLRVFRVFVSSTFGDMKAERDELAKFVFPELRKLCEKRAVAWGVVDLRWGITDAQQQQGEILPICLHDIERCNVFIGLLGERYGTLPSSIPEELEARQPWLREHREHSVTALEIMHGVLRKSPQDVRAHFYFRDPRYINSLPVDQRAAHCESSPERKAKLAAMKEQIRQRGFRHYENYADPTALGKLVLADLVKLLDELYPEKLVPDPLAREAAEHEAYADSRRRVYIGGDKYFERLDQHADGDGLPLVILGESGSGKSALLANWAARYREHHPDVLIIQHFIGSSVYSTDWAAMVRRIMGEFKRPPFHVTQEIPDKPDELRLAFANFLSMAAAQERVILMLDGLNQLEDRDQAPDLVWLPPEIPGNVRLIVSTLPGRSLDDLTKRQWPTLQVEPLTPDERAALIQRYLYDVQSRRLADVQVQEIAAAPVTSNPLYLEVLLEELGTYGDHATLRERIRHYLAVTSVDELFSKVLARYEKDYERERPGLVKDMMIRLWAARRGLSEVELLEMLGQDGRPLPRAIWSPLYLAAEHALVSRSGLIGFFHDFMRGAVEKHYLSSETEQCAAHILIADYFSSGELGPRKVDELPWQLAEATEWRRLYELLGDLDFFNEAWKASQWAVLEFWARVESASDLKMANAYMALDFGSGHPTEELWDLWSYAFGVEHVAERLWNLSLMMAATGHLDQALKIRRYLVRQARALGDSDALQASLGNEAVALMRRGDSESAMRLFKEQEELSRELQLKDGLQSSLGNQALIMLEKGNLESAQAMLDEQENLCRNLGNRHSLQACLGSQALVLRRRGQLDAAMTKLKAQEEICREMGFTDGMRHCLGNQAIVLQDSGDLDGAMALHEREEHLCRDTGDKDGLQRSLQNQATLLLRRNDPVGALNRVRERAILCRESGDNDGVENALAFLAAIIAQCDKEGDTVALLQEHAELCRRLDNKPALQRCLLHLAMLMVGKGFVRPSLKVLDEHEELSRQFGQPEHLALNKLFRAMCLSNLPKCREEALSLAEEARQLTIGHGLTGLEKVTETAQREIQSRVRIAGGAPSKPPGPQGSPVSTPSEDLGSIDNQEAKEKVPLGQEGVSIKDGARGTLTDPLLELFDLMSWFPLWWALGSLLAALVVQDSWLTRTATAPTIGLAVGYPAFCIQLWRFVTPGLRPSERVFALPIMIATPILLGALALLLAPFERIWASLSPGLVDSGRIPLLAKSLFLALTAVVAWIDIRFGHVKNKVRRNLLIMTALAVAIATPALVSGLILAAFQLLALIIASVWIASGHSARMSWSAKRVKQIEMDFARVESFVKSKTR